MNMNVTTADSRVRTAMVLISAVILGTIGFLLADSPARSAVGMKAATHAGATLSLRKTTLGAILVSSTGRTAYLFSKDRGGASSCTGTCATYWPPVTSVTKPTAGSGVKVALLGRTKRSDGRMQVTYNRHPLYTFALDKVAGQVKGEGNLAFGAKWYGVSAAGAAVTGGSKTGTTTTTSPTYTYPTYP